jgi:uncharacterized protein (TIGR03435 family)
MMKQAILSVLALIFPAMAARSQVAKPAFEVAVVRPAEPPSPTRRIRIGLNGGPGSNDPSRITAESVSMTELLMRAYDVKRYQLSGPAWMETERYSVSAKVPEGATKEQLPLMLQSLLAERFKLTIHRDQKEMPVFELQVAKGGPKLKESAESAPGTPDAPAPPPVATGPVRMQLDAEGYPIPPPGRNVMMFINGRGRYQAVQQPVADLVSILTNQLGRPVIDATGLTGKYDFTLSFAMSGIAPAGAMVGPPPPPPPPGGGGGAEPAGVGGPDSDPGPSLPSALQQQLGLKLESKKGMVDIVVIDRVERVPTEN